MADLTDTLIEATQTARARRERATRLDRPIDDVKRALGALRREVDALPDIPEGGGTDAALRLALHMLDLCENGVEVIDLALVEPAAPDLDAYPL